MAVALDQRLGVYGDASVENKTSGTKQVLKAKEQNVLNNYRISTYNFTLAAVRRTDVNDPLSYRKKLDLVILKSGGKGTTGLSTNVTSVLRKKTTQVQSDEGIVQDVTTTQEDFSAGNLVKTFNNESPGRFDMFIENVEIESMMGFTEVSGVTLPTSLRFDVIEPYSINGFVEALHTAAVAAGYLNYAQASFVLKMEFVGYPDSADITSPQIVPQSTRYFLFSFTGLQVEVTEKGTRYRCAAVPFNEKAFGELNTLKTSVGMSGETVEKILKNLLENLNDQIVKADQASKNGKAANMHDTYSIAFPVIDKSKPGGLDFDSTNVIGKSDILDIARDNTLFEFSDPGDANTKRVAYQIKGGNSSSESLNSKDSKPRIQFRDGAKIHEMISSVIRDSTYIRNILKTLGTSGVPDDYGNIKYFMVKIEVTNKAEIDAVSRKPYQNYRYVVIPYDVHYTRIPGYQSAKFDTSKIKTTALREYNYIYTGQNVDVLGFKLNFNNLFFEAIPQALGNNDIPSVEFSSGKTEDTNVKLNPDDPKKLVASEVPIANLLPSSRFTQIQQIGGNGGQMQDDPYFALARSMHAAIIDSKTAMLTGDIDILGDPFFLVQGGIGNYNPTEDVKGKTKDGDANHQYGEVLININFRNPIDIAPFEQGGKLYFDPNTVPFSGIYRVNKVHSTFSEGIFKQRLTILRMPGQIIDNTKSTNIKDRLITETKIDSSTSETTTPKQGTNE